MKIEIDQSGKVEDTAKITVLAFVSNTGIQRTIVIPKSTKRQLQELYRLAGQPEIFIYHVFAVGLFYLIKPISVSSIIVIDNEYPRKDKIILPIIEILLAVYERPKHELSIEQIGNHPAVHYAAKDVFDGKEEANEILSLKKFLVIQKKADGRLRACLATLVDAQTRSFYPEYTRKRKIVKRVK